MNYTYKVKIDGKWVDLSSLPEEKQQEIKAELTRKIAYAIGEAQAKCS